jgi:DNA-binding beta-propeller fold protein YncE/predicted flap endonuclease-1-like 5' DNA nuclease
MKLEDHYDGTDNPFEGDLTLQWRSLPANALVSKATLRITPTKPADGALFQEIIRFSNGQGDLGATKNLGNGFVEVDFHKRRTLASVAGNSLANTNLQVDMGGIYVEINVKGAIKAPGDDPFELPGDGTLPGVTVERFKLTPASADRLDVRSVTIRSVPSNLTVRLGALPSVWTRLGEMTAAETSPDFTPTLQALLRNATVKNGFYQIPVILHSDSICRLSLELEIEYVIQANLQPPGLQEVVLPFDYSTLSKTDAGVLSVALPRDAVVVSQGTAARVKGAFDSTRIAYGPTGEVTVTDGASVSPAESQAQSLALESPLPATAVDLLLTGVSRTAKLRLDLRGDLDGKPDVVSLLSQPAEFSLEGAVAGQSSWVSVVLPSEFHFHGGTQRYWIVLQALDGTVLWGLEAAASDAVALQHTEDGGLSWHDTPSSKVPGALAAYFRLRDTPDRFQVPVELQVGTGAAAVRLKLDRYQPLGRVDFSLDGSDVSKALNQYTDKALGPAPPEGEQLANGSFEQWNVLGDAPGPPGSISMSPNPRAVAVSPDGRWAYVAGASSDTNGVSFLTGIDVTCDQAKTTIRLANLQSDAPQSIAVHPDGTRIYILGSLYLDVFDAATWTELGALEGEKLVEAGGAFGPGLVVSRDGSRLYVTTAAKVVIGLDTAKLERAVTGQATLVSSDILKFPVDGPAWGLALSPDGIHLYATMDMHTLGGRVAVIDTSTGQGTSISVGNTPCAIALTPDGSLAVIANVGDCTLSILDTSSVQAAVIPLGSPPAGVAISPDGRRAFVATIQAGMGTANGLTIIDLARRAKSGLPIPLETVPGALAINPEGDRLYIVPAVPSPEIVKASLVYIPFGVRVPAEWALTSGQVLLVCLGDLAPTGIAVVLGRRADSKFLSNTTATALSQVVPVSASRHYTFSFWGVAGEPGAGAEVFWLGQSCGAARTDRLPIPVGDISKRDVSLAVSRAQFTAPAGASQAEIRFSAPSGVLAGIARASLMASSDALANGDFLSRDQQGALAGWTQPTQASSQILVTSGDGGALIKNPGKETAELLQSVTINGGKSFVLRFTGQALALTSTQDHPRVEVHWLAQDGSETGSAISLEVLPGDFDRHAASGTTPANTAQAAVHLVLPGATGLAAPLVALEAEELPPLPLGFIAQAPGELRVSQATVGYDSRPGGVAPVPPGGLCTPTPPGMNPGEAPSDSCFCPCCQEGQPVLNPSPAVTSASRPVLVGECPNCGAEMVSPGGRLVASAPTLSLTRLPVVSAVPATVAPRVMVTEAPPLTAIPGIGTGRERQLVAAGIKSVKDLSGALPGTVARAVKGLSVENAAGYIERAKANLASLEQPHPMTAGWLGRAAAPTGAPPQPVTVVTGIGPDRARRLARAGINSVEDLALASPQDVARALRKSGVSAANAAALVSKARILASSK